MSFVEKSRFKEGHYVGKPAEYDDLFVKRRIQLLLQVPEISSKALTLVDVGCGNGNTMLKLAPYFKEVVGIDIFEQNKTEFKAQKDKNLISNASFLGIVKLRYIINYLVLKITV